jgi:hypothetical protein
MRAAKARGEVERFPGGRRAKGLPPLSKDKTIRRAQRILEAQMVDVTKRIPAALVEQWDELSPAQKLAIETNTGLSITRRILDDGDKLLCERGLEEMRDC